MGQYFLIVNIDKHEYVEPWVKKLWEICANNDIRILGYLLATNNPDGIREIWTRAKELKYFGRWCGDRIALVGDYADEATNYTGPSYEHVLQTFKDITEKVVEEFNQFIESPELSIVLPKYIRPDIVIRRVEE
ncbi:MAG: hypothetical protein QW304_07655 [Thermoproteota archaeon]